MIVIALFRSSIGRMSDMTYKQFMKKAEVARQIGSALLSDGCILYYRGNNCFALYDRCGNCVEVSQHGPHCLAYLMED